MKAKSLGLTGLTLLLFLIVSYVDVCARGAEYGPGEPAIATGDTAGGGSADTAAQLSEERLLVQRLEQAGLINQIAGYTVDKNGAKLFINGVERKDANALNSMKALKKENIHIEVFPFLKRLEMHPDASFLQILLPEALSSPCVDYGKKPGC